MQSLVSIPSLRYKLPGQLFGLSPGLVPPEEEETQQLVVGNIRISLTESPQLQGQHLLV